ncbi:MAG TPA: class I SAM-dependent methyltransferase [Solirubrobacteraceae bacterium]|nr:class I SAM-dependent methyltransferase [Solirubrobacteraceae bacterium]
MRRVRWLHKARAVRRCGHQVRRHWQFVLASPEPDNYTYEITNEAELAAWAAGVARCEEADARALVQEPSHDVELAERLRTATAHHWLWTKSSPPFGKRLGWYALARALRPRRVIEIGAHDGLGSMLLLRALELNQREGFPGTLVSFDVNPAAGWLVGEHPLWELRIQSSDKGLPEVVSPAAPVDMLVYDGWHTFEAEYADLRAAADHLSPGGVLVSDDAQVTRALAHLAEERGFDYSEFQEIPVDHFYPGAMLGAGRPPA